MAHKTKNPLAASGSKLFLLLLITESPLAPYVGGYQNRNQYEWAVRFMRVLYFDFQPDTTHYFSPPPALADMAAQT